MVRHSRVLTGVMIVTAIGAVRPQVPQSGPAPSGSVASQHAPEKAMVDRDGITAPREVHAFLDRARQALGGQARLHAVRSLLIDSTLTFEGQRPTPRQWRLLLPNRFAEIRPTVRYVIDGANYYQEPEPAQDAKEDARKALATTFTEQCLVLLLRASSLEPVRADFKETATTGAKAVIFTRPDGSFVGIEFDAGTCRPQAYYRTSSVSMSGNTTTGTRRVVIDETKQIGGISFPTAMTMVQQGFPTPVKMAFTRIEVNQNVTLDDFRRR